MNRLVATAFELPRTVGQTQVNHIDRDPCNNCVWNLEWASPSENMKHSFETNATRKSNATKQSKAILGRKLDESDWTPYENSNHAARTLNLDSRNISACCNGKNKRVGAYEFKFDVPNEPDCLDGEEWNNIDTSVLSF